MPTVSSIDLVIFDCDGVLIDSELASASALRDAAATWGIDIPISHIVTKFVGLPYSSVAAQIEKHFQTQLPDNFELDYRQRLFTAFSNGLNPMPGVLRVLEKLAVPCCVATSSSLERATCALELAGLSKLVGKYVFTAADVEHGKPAPDLFLFACDRMKGNPTKTLVVEDSHSGIQAALNADMWVTRFTGGSHITNKNVGAGAHSVLRDFSSFFTYYPQLRKSDR